VTQGYKPLKHETPVRSLVPTEDMDRMIVEAQKTVIKTNAFEETKVVPVEEKGLVLADYLRFMCATGARRLSALFVTWKDVDFVRRQVRLVKTKYSKQTVIDFNPTLEALLVEMHQRKHATSPWLFPEPERPEERAKLRETFDRLRAKLGLNIIIHDCRHYFISNCVMSGIDFMTIAKWVGHADGGVLIGKVYGHLSAEHTQAAAAKVTFGKKPVVSDEQPATIDLTKVKAEDLLALLAKLQQGTAPKTPA
jgi:integrase